MFCKKSFFVNILFYYQKSSSNKERQSGFFWSENMPEFDGTPSLALLFRLGS
jgi:hypothetical protein